MKKYKGFKKFFIIASFISFFMYVFGFICKKFCKKNIDCDEYNEDLESLKNKNIEIDLYVEEQNTMPKNDIKENTTNGKDNSEA